MIFSSAFSLLLALKISHPSLSFITEIGDVKCRTKFNVDNFIKIFYLSQLMGCQDLPMFQFIRLFGRSMVYYQIWSTYMKVLPLICETHHLKAKQKEKKKVINVIFFLCDKKYIKNYANITNVSVSYYNTYIKRNYESDYRCRKILR